MVAPPRCRELGDATWMRERSHPFGDPTKYEVVYGGKRYAPKAVLGLACKYLLGSLLAPGQFSGEAPGHVKPKLRQIEICTLLHGIAWNPCQLGSILS